MGVKFVFSISYVMAIVWASVAALFLVGSLAFLWWRRRQLADANRLVPAVLRDVLATGIPASTVGRQDVSDLSTMPLFSSSRYGMDFTHRHYKGFNRQDSTTSERPAAAAAVAPGDSTNKPSDCARVEPNGGSNTSSCNQVEMVDITTPLISTNILRNSETRRVGSSCYQDSSATAHCYLEKREEEEEGEEERAKDVSAVFIPPSAQPYSSPILLVHTSNNNNNNSSFPSANRTWNPLNLPHRHSNPDNSEPSAHYKRARHPDTDTSVSFVQMDLVEEAGARHTAEGLVHHRHHHHHHHHHELKDQRSADDSTASSSTHNNNISISLSTLGAPHNHFYVSNHHIYSSMNTLSDSGDSSKQCNMSGSHADAASSTNDNTTNRHHDHNDDDSTSVKPAVVENTSFISNLSIYYHAYAPWAPDSFSLGSHPSQHNNTPASDL